MLKDKLTEALELAQTEDREDVAVLIEQAIALLDAQPRSGGSGHGVPGGGG